LRVILSPDEYQRHKERLYVAQGGRCADCGGAISLWQAELHHSQGRGQGGGFRDDLHDGNRLVCRNCHSAADKNRESKFKAEA
jgi:hypothetical protein